MAQELEERHGTVPQSRQQGHQERAIGQHGDHPQAREERTDHHLVVVARDEREGDGDDDAGGSEREPQPHQVGQEAWCAVGVAQRVLAYSERLRPGIGQPQEDDREAEDGAVAAEVRGSEMPRHRGRPQHGYERPSGVRGHADHAAAHDVAARLGAVE